MTESAPWCSRCGWTATEPPAACQPRDGAICPLQPAIEARRDLLKRKAGTYAERPRPAEQPIQSAGGFAA